MVLISPGPPSPFLTKVCAGFFEKLNGNLKAISSPPVRVLGADL
jgi:hypothetical protein